MSKATGMKLDATSARTAARTEAVKTALSAGLPGSDVATIMDQVKSIVDEDE